MRSIPTKRGFVLPDGKVLEPGYMEKTLHEDIAMAYITNDASLRERYMQSKNSHPEDFLVYDLGAILVSPQGLRKICVAIGRRNAYISNLIDAYSERGYEMQIL